MQKMPNIVQGIMNNQPPAPPFATTPVGCIDDGRSRLARNQTPIFEPPPTKRTRVVLKSKKRYSPSLCNATCSPPSIPPPGTSSLHYCWTFSLTSLAASAFLAVSRLLSQLSVSLLTTRAVETAALPWATMPCCSAFLISLL